MGNRFFCAVAVVLTATTAFSDGGSSFFDGGWRVSAGGVWSFGGKSKLNAAPEAVFGPATSRADAEAAARRRARGEDAVVGGKGTQTRTDYSEGT